MTRIITSHPARYVFAPSVRPVVNPIDLLEEATDMPLNPYSRLFVFCWLMGTVVAVAVPYLF